MNDIVVMPTDQSCYDDYCNYILLNADDSAVMWLRVLVMLAKQVLFLAVSVCMSVLCTEVVHSHKH